MSEETPTENVSSTVSPPLEDAAEAVESEKAAALVQNKVRAYHTLFPNGDSSIILSSIYLLPYLPPSPPPHETPSLKRFFSFMGNNMHGIKARAGLLYSVNQLFKNVTIVIKSGLYPHFSIGTRRLFKSKGNDRIV